MNSERRHAIMTILAVRESIRVSELRERLQVSDVTIRKDLEILEEQGALVRIHGGARLAQRHDPNQTVALREHEHRDAKDAIAAASLQLIHHGETIYLDAGTTVARLAHHLVDMELRVVTNSLQVLNILVDQPGISLMMIGGAYRHRAGSFIGPWAEENLRRVHVDRAFLGTSGIDGEGRFAAQNSIEAQTKMAAIRAARTAVVLADRTKIGVQAFQVFAEPADIAVLVTDAPREVWEPLEAAGIHVIATSENHQDTQRNHIRKQ